MEQKEKKGKVLVVDDEESLRDICREALTEHGYEVIEAENGAMALDILRKDPSVDIVLSDLKMPEMDGLALIERIKKFNFDVDMVVMTGFGTIETAVEVMKKGALDYIPKPFYLNHLLVKLDSAFKRRMERKERERLDKLVQILKLNRDLNAKLELSSVLNEFLFHVERTFSPEGSLIFLLKPSYNNMEILRIRGLFKTTPMLLNAVKKIGNMCVSRGKSLIHVPGKLRDRDLVNMKEERLLEAYQIMIAPFIGKSGPFGAVSLVRKLDAPFFNEEELQLLTVFASQTAAIIENAQLYGKVIEMNREVIRSLAKAVEAKDSYTKGHSDQVAHYALKLGRKLGLSSKELDRLYWAGIVHDIGKIGIPDSILNKPGKLTTQEYEVMKKHPVIGREILSQVETLQDIMPIIYHHHERVDGKGYPDGVGGDDIPFLSKVISVVDAFDAMTSDRAYRQAMEPSRAVSILENGAGYQWDEELVYTWSKILRQEKKI